VETFSCWPVAIPVKTQTTLEAAQKLIEHVFSMYGCPLSLHSDQGRSFEAQLLKDILTLYGVTKTRTTAFHPRSNGKAEVFVKTLKQHLCMLVRQDQKDWPRQLPLICQVYRGLPTASTSTSPFEIMFGSHMRMPIDLVRGQPTTYLPCQFTKKQYKDYPLLLRQHLWEIHKIVRENIGVTAQRMKANYDKTANYIPFQVGDKVWLFTPLRIKGKCPKIMTDWTGPSIIRNILNDCVVRIQW